MPNSLLGPVKVTPLTAKPGEPVLVQACDTTGRPYVGDSGIVVTIQGIEGSSRYYQFGAPGTKKLTVCALKGNVRETSVAIIHITGQPMMFRTSLTSAPQTGMPIIQADLKLGNPYLVSFRLGTPKSIQPLLATRNTQPNAGVGNAPAAKPAAAPAVEFVAFSKALASLPSAGANGTPVVKEGTINGVKMTARGAGAIGLVGTKPVQAPPVATSYVWDFGDGTTLTTQSAAAMHDYFPAIRAQKLGQNFNVSCKIVHDNLTVTRTLYIISAYGVSKGLGTIVPHHTGDDYAVFQHVGFSGSMIVHNIEDQSLELNRMAVVAISQDRNAELAAPNFVQMEQPVIIPAHGALGMGVYVSTAQLGHLGPNVAGFTVYYLGNLGLPARLRGLAMARNPAIENSAAGAKLPPTPLPKADVRFTHTFKIRLTDSGMVSSTIGKVSNLAWDHASALNAISAGATNPAMPISKAGNQVLDPATHTVAIELSAKSINVATEAQVRSSVQAGLASIAINAGAVTDRGGSPFTRSQPDTRTRMLAGPPPPDALVAAGNICDPDNISDADAATAKAQSLACQLTDQTEEVLMPGAFQNALKGDVILSPGQDSADNLIGALLRSLNPPQFHSHSGLMTQNFYEITHCTAAPDRITASDNLAGPGGVLGIKPDILHYAWPGSITQPIDDRDSGGGAVSGQRWNDPNDPSGNTFYTIQGFNPEPIGIENGNDFVLVYPMVIKPLPENEAVARPLLRKAADIARTKGARVDKNGALIQAGGCYYSFYCYTKPEISAGFTDPAPASAGWAQGHSPAVCSSFVWLTMKAAGINLLGPSAIETVGELSPTALAEGAAVGATTLDGLFYYSQAARQQAAQVLNTIIYNQAQEHEGFAQYIPVVGSDIAQNIADQIMNMFAFGDPNMYGSSAWQNPGDANAVSPDNISWWNPPCFGYAEQLQYLEQHVEQYTVSRWQRVTTYGTVSGVVTRQDNGSPVSGAHVSLNDSLAAVTDAMGRFQIINVPTGSYNLKAWAAITVNGVQVQVANGPDGPAGQGQKITTTPANPNLNLQVVLQLLPKYFRRLDLQFQWSSDHGDANPWNNHGVRNEGPETAVIPLGPGVDGYGTTGTYSYSFDYDGKGLFRCEYDFTAALLADLSIQVTLIGRMIDDGSNSEQTEYTIDFNVPLDGQNAGWWISLENSGAGYHNGPAKITGTATNSQATG